MRTPFPLVTAVTLALAGCQKAENKPIDTGANPSAAITSDGPNQPGPPSKPRPSEAAALLAQAAKFGGYESTWGEEKSDIVPIQFRSPGPKDADLESLRPLLLKSPVPVGINLNGCESITDAGVAHLKDIGTLRRLSLDSKKVTAEGLKHISGLTNLEELYLANDAITDAALAHLGKLTNLRKLSVYSKSVTDAGYAHLTGLVNLEEIHAGGISYEIGDECLGHMKGMTKLKDLSIGRDKLTDAGMSHLKNFTELRKLRIDGPKVTAAGVAQLAPLKKLQTLTVLSGGGFTGDSLAALKDMTELRELELIYTGALDKTGGMHIGKLTGLKKLRLGSVQDGGLEGIAKLTGLEDLDMNYSHVGDGDMKYLSGLTGLKRLDVQKTRVTDAGLKPLSGLTSLRDLSAAGNNITDAGLAFLAAIPSLEILRLTECKITGSGFKELTKLSKLKEFGVSGNPVTDDHVMVLKDIRGLKEVSFTGTKVSEEVALALKKARPDMRVRDVAGDDVVLDKKPVTRPKPPTEDISKVEPAFKLSAEEFYKEYEVDKNAAAEKYKGKVIELSGEVDSVGRNFNGDAFVTLKKEKQLIGVMCGTVDEQPWAKVVRGQKVKLKGKYPEFSISAALIACVFVETGKYAAIPLTAVDLAKEYADDSEKTVKKYEKKYLALSGEVVAKEFNSAGAAKIILKTDNKVKVACSFTASEKDLTKPIKVGQKIKVVGEFTLNFAGGDEVALYFCLPLSGS